MAGQSTTAGVLQGGVQETVTIDSVKPGDHWSDSILPKVEDNWFRIPKWLAGSWHIETKDAFWSRNGKPQQPITELNRTDICYGTLKDRKGNIWEWDEIGSARDIENDGGTGKVISLGKIIRTPPPRMFAFDRKTTDIHIREGTVSSVVRRYDRLHLWLQPDGRLHGSDDILSDPGTRLETDATKTKDFEPLNVSATGKDLRQSFADYLIAHGLSRLVPTK